MAQEAEGNTIRQGVLRSIIRSTVLNALTLEDVRALDPTPKQVREVLLGVMFELQDDVCKSALQIV